MPMLCYPPDSFFGQTVRAEVLPELMRRQQVVVRCVSEFAMGLRELALVGQGAAWLPALLIQDDLRRGALLPLDRLGRSVAMDIAVFFAVLAGDKGEMLMRQFRALHGAAELEQGAELKLLQAAPAPQRRRKSPPRDARARPGK